MAGINPKRCLVRFSEFIFLYICLMRRFFSLLFALWLFGSGCGLQASGRSCRMAKDGKSENCPCSSKKDKKKCCKTFLKPVKHLNAGIDSRKKLVFPNLVLIPIPLVFPTYVSIFPVTSIFRGRPASKPPDVGLPAYLRFRNFRC